MKTKILRVLDPCTVECVLFLPLNLQAVRPVRLLGIEPVDASQCLTYLEALVGIDLTLSVREDKTGKYGQLLGSFYRKGRNINKQMVKEGLCSRRSDLFKRS